MSLWLGLKISSAGQWCSSARFEEPWCKLLQYICIVLAFLGQRGKFLVARNQQILLEVGSVWSHPWKAVAQTSELWASGPLLGQAHEMKTLWLFSRRGAAKPAAGPEFLPWSCWRAQTPWHDESLSSLSHNQMGAWQTHQNQLSRTSDSTCREPHAGYQYGWFSQCSTAHLNGLIYKDLMLKESKWVWVVAFRQGDHTDDVRLNPPLIHNSGIEICYFGNTNETLEWKLHQEIISRLFTILGAQPIFEAKAYSAHFSGGLESVLVG